MQVIHYVSFLMDHGWAPYRQIGDMNMPGAYMLEHLALHLYGSSDLGWRLYDFTLCLIAGFSMVAIARRTDWIAGLCAGALFALFHAADGPFAAGQRDQMMAVLMIAGWALCFESLRRKQPWLMGLSGLVTAMAAAIKPTLLLAGPLLLLLAVLELRRSGSRVRAWVLWTLAGFVAAGGMVFGFLAYYRSTHAFFHLLSQTIPHYAGLHQVSFLWIAGHCLQRPLYVFVGLAVCASWYAREKVGWEDRALLLGVGLGLLSYLVQRRGSPQHRYTLLAFVLTWASLRLFQAMQSGATARSLGAVALLFVLIVCVPSTSSMRGSTSLTITLRRRLKAT